jgi:hypothetical protein
MSADDRALADRGGAGQDGSRVRRAASPGAVQLIAGRELALERRHLLGPEPAHPAALGDAEALHQLPGPDLADPGIEHSRSTTRILPMTSLR